MLRNTETGSVYPTIQCDRLQELFWLESRDRISEIIYGILCAILEHIFRLC